MKLRSLELRVLRALALFASPVPSTLLLNVTSCCDLSLDAIDDVLDQLEREAFALSDDNGGAEELWRITPQGEQELIAQGAAAPAEPIADPEPAEPATALCCISEDVLDEWWAEQDVDVKADAFLKWSLDRYTCFIHVDDRIAAVPIIGEANCTTEAEARIAERTREMARQAVSQADGAAEEAVQQ